MEETLEMESPDQHWLEKLFPPRFSEEDFFSQVHQPEPLICEKLASERARRIKGLYNMAVTKFQEEKRPQRKESPSSLIIKRREAGLEGTKINISKEKTEADSAWRTTNLDVGSEESIAETEGHCIWKAKECTALRREMHREHLGSLSLKLQLPFLKAELAELKAQRQKLVAGFEEAKQELSQSRKEALCKAAQLEEIQKQSRNKDAKIEALERELLEKSGRVRSFSKELQQAREEILRLELHKKDLQWELEKLKEERGFENKLSIAKAKLQHDEEIKKIQRELEEANRALASERALNTKHAAALEMLKKHFLGPPSSDPIENLSIYFI
ncbi:coiled-coil domain-containing protein 160 isoform X2 [Hemicordylus capensis]|uniref:coiled-coil domain-containing protein 160 isoform X2 n=1 Tax=Hemicordylus capensis TaxID=884348 RepID=UPI0023025761|nr:coiled-coil domain-containing protein 160 isoform X2 [Hemicordylus capensis]